MLKNEGKYDKTENKHTGCISPTSEIDRESVVFTPRYHSTKRQQNSNVNSQSCK